MCKHSYEQLCIPDCVVEIDFVVLPVSLISGVLVCGSDDVMCLLLDCGTVLVGWFVDVMWAVLDSGPSDVVGPIVVPVDCGIVLVCVALDVRGAVLECGPVTVVGAAVVASYNKNIYNY